MTLSAVVIFSGGMDSATLLYKYWRDGYNVKAISFDYGQRHRKELKAARAICQDLGVEHRIIDLSAIRPLLAGSSQTDAVDVPEGHYAADNMKLTVVPNRNMIMLAVAGAWAVSLKADVLAYGAHAGDHTNYPDCRKTFVDPMAQAFLNCDWHFVKLEAPFLDQSKGQMAKVGAALGVPFEKTWTCYKGLEKHCGKCGACQERKEAFQVAGVSDPTVYEDAGVLA
jgi:7-cyano-7-deazaguanine synthase